MGQQLEANHMDLRAKISCALKQAMKDKDQTRLSTLRLINAAIKDKDIDARAAGKENGVGQDEVLAILSKMTKQRAESVRAYEEGGRLDLAESEQAEIAVIEEFLPQKLNADETKAAVDAAITEVGAAGIRDMGRVMGILKSRYTGQLDFSHVGPLVKDKLCTGASTAA